jgi:hypothetical protein
VLEGKRDFLFRGLLVVCMAVAFRLGAPSGRHPETPILDGTETRVIGTPTSLKKGPYFSFHRGGLQDALPRAPGILRFGRLPPVDSVASS